MTETITAVEVGMLLGLAAARDQRTVGDTDIVAWHKDLNRARVTYPDAEAAMDQFYGVDLPALPRERRFRITAADVIAAVQKIRGGRLETFQYRPPATEDDPAYYARLRGQIRDVASGALPAPVERLMITGGPHRDITDRSAGIGRQIPADDSPAAQARKLGPLGYECPECHAVVGHRCRNAGLGKPRRLSHPLRLRLAAGKPLPTPVQLAAEQLEMDRRIAASKARLAAEGGSNFVPPGRDEAS